MPEIEKVIGECGLLAKPGDPEDFASKILEIARNPELRRHMGERARELAEKSILGRSLQSSLRKFIPPASPHT